MSGGERFMNNCYESTEKCEIKSVQSWSKWVHEKVLQGRQYLNLKEANEGLEVGIPEMTAWG